MSSFGRTVITTDVEKVDASNVVDVLNDALFIHRRNSLETQHLMDVYRGKQIVLDRTKTVRPEINNHVVINHANEIVSFKVSYLLSDPIAYVSRGINDVAEKIKTLNEFMYLEGKSAKDKEIADYFSICGNAYRMVLPNENKADDESPFSVYTLDPRYTFVIYHNGLGDKPVCGVKYIVNKGNQTIYSIYTENYYFEIIDSKITKNESHTLGIVPIFEYVNNSARLGAFEIVETLLDAINDLASNRVDATAQAVQALMVFTNCDITSDDYNDLLLKGAVKIKSIDGQDAGITLLTADFKQADQQVLMDALYNEVMKVTGMPTQSSETTSDSSNNGAAIVKNGWFHAEARAKDTELLWRESENNFLKLVLKICRETNLLDLKLSDITEKFTRRNYEDIQVKSQVLTTMLSNDKIAPRLAFAHCGMFTDSEEAFTESMEWYEIRKKEIQAEAEQQAKLAASLKPKPAVKKV